MRKFIHMTANYMGQNTIMQTFCSLLERNENHLMSGINTFMRPMRRVLILHIKVIKIVSRQALTTCSLLMETRRQNQTQRQKNLFTMTLEGFVIIVRNNSVIDGKQYSKYLTEQFIKVRQYIGIRTYHKSYYLCALLSNTQVYQVKNG